MMEIFLISTFRFNVCVYVWSLLTFFPKRSLQVISIILSFDRDDGVITAGWKLLLNSIKLHQLLDILCWRFVIYSTKQIVDNRTENGDNKIL